MSFIFCNYISMEIITTLKREDLEQMIYDQISKCLNSKLSPPQPEPSDRCGINEACVILGTPERPVSKALIYKLTHEKRLKFMKFGRALVFSRQALIDYREENTVLPSSMDDEIKTNLVKSAKKHLRNEK